MTTFRLLRCSSVYQLCNKGMSSEPMVASYQPSKLALRTAENDPTKQKAEDLGKLYNMPDNVRKKLFPKYGLPLYFERLCDTFYENSIVVRQPALELIEYLKKTDYSRPMNRYLIHGRFGCGKSLTLIHTLNYAFNNGFIIVYVPSVWKWFHWSREVVSSEKDPSIFDLPLEASGWLRNFEMTNAELISKLDLRTSQTYQWSNREKTSVEAPLNEMIYFGINRVKFACQVVDALLSELKIHSCNNRCKTFVGIDGYNGFFQSSSKLKTPEKVKFIPSNASLTKSFLNFLRNDWNNSAAVLVADRYASVKGEFTTDLPFHLLRKAGVEHIDPFIPIHVPEYTPLEFENYLDYLEEKRWLQKPDGRDEIAFVTQRNPRLLTSYCASH